MSINEPKEAITASELYAEADKLEQMNNKLKVLVDELVETEIELQPPMFSGDSKDAFTVSFRQDKNKLFLYIDGIKKYIAALRTIAAKYEAAEKNRDCFSEVSHD